MAAQDVQMPRFGKASGGGSESWGDGDGFDVDMLTEFLLNDGSFNSNGVTFDFSMDAGSQLSATVSPENSVDGALPSVTDASSAPSVQNYVAGKETNDNAVSGVLKMSNVPIAPSPSVPGMPSGPMVFQSQQQQLVAKRRRIDGSQAPVMAVATGAPVHPAFATEQLAAAAAQALQNQGRGRKKSQAQVERRRERNRILARRTRLRKKFFFESLQKEIMDLQRENLMLKELVKMNIGGEEGEQILSGCNAADSLPAAVLEACGEEAGMDSQDFNLVKSIQKSQHSFVITDPSLQDNPIVFASDDFLKLTGYSREQVLGRNCRFLQGTDTHHDKVESLRKALSGGDDVTVTMVNYTSDGTPFWNKLFIAALRDAQNNIVNFIGVIVKVAGPEPGDPEYVEDKESSPDDAVKAIEGAMESATGA